jgi:hypothetical protein
MRCDLRIRPIFSILADGRLCGCVFWAVANLALTGYAALLVVFLVRVIGLTPGVVGTLSLSGTLLLTHALTGRRNLPGTVPAA